MKQANKFTVIHRILHWVMAVAMSVLFITGFLRMYWMNKKHIVTIIERKIDPEIISKSQLSEIASTIREPMWEWHVIFAYVMIISFIVRIIYMLLKGIRFPNPFAKKQPFKERFQGFIYVYFYVFVALSAVTGVCIKNDFLPQWKENIETIHKWGIYWFPIFILFHLVGIVLAEYSSKKGIVSKMIGGE